MTTLPPYSHIAVLGGGAWGTALAIASVTAGRDTILWAREEDVVAGIAQTHENKRFLPGVILPKTLRVTGALDEACRADALLLTMPAQVLGSSARMLAPIIAPGLPLVICAKGIEKDTGRLVNEVLADAAPLATLAILSGPSFARDVARGLPTAVTIAARADVAERLQASLNSPAFRPYASDDITGVALGAPPRMSMPSPAAWSKAWALAKMRALPCWREASPNWRGWARPWAPNAKP